MRSLFMLLIPVLSLLVFSCDSATDSKEDDSLYLRIQNGTTAAISVVIQPHEGIDQSSQLTADFGTVASGATSGYMEVNGSFYVFVNGEPFGTGSTASFGIDHDPTSNWTLTINSLTGGWSLQADFN